MPERNDQPINSDTDNISDAQAYLNEWTRGVRLQRERLVTAINSRSRDSLQVDATFLVVAAHGLYCAVRMLERHDKQGVKQAIARFEESHGYLVVLRNALLHWDGYIAGTGRAQAANGHVWFPYGVSWREGRPSLLIPPLVEEQASAIDLFLLADDVLALGLEGQRIANLATIKALDPMMLQKSRVATP